MAVSDVALAVLALTCVACGAGRSVPSLPPSSAEAVRFEVVVNGVRGTQGMVRGAIFAAAAGFPMDHERALFRAEAPARDGTVLEFDNLPPGDYALAVLHDSDGDGKMARNALGIPREGYALSGATAGLPRFDAAVIRLAPPLCRMELRLRYW